MSGPDPAHDLPRTLARAEDAKIAKVVAVIEALPERGDADRLLAALRPRLAQLRPRRRVNFARLLFTPLDPVIVAGGDWRRGMAAVPRPVLPVLAGTVLAAIDGGPAAWEQRLLAAAGDPAALDALGATLWPQAAAILATAAPPADWQARTGIATSEHAAIAAGVAVLLAHAVPVRVMRDTVAHGGALDPARLRPLLLAAGAGGPATWSLVLGVLFAQLPPGLVTAMAAEVRPDGPSRHAAESALDDALERLEALAAIPGLGAGPDTEDAAREALRIATVLGGLDPARQPPERRRQMEQIRRHAEATCRTRLADGLQNELLGPWISLAASASDAAVAALERSARALRGFEQAASRLGGAAALATLLRETAERLPPAAASGAALSPVDAARMTEILLGPEAAMAVLRAG